MSLVPQIAMFKNFLLYPYWAIRIASGAKSFRDNPLIGSKRLNQMGLHTARMRAAHKLAWFRRGRMEKVLPAEYSAQFKKNGFILIPGFLDPDVFASLRDQIYSTSAPAREMVQGDTITRRIAIGHDYLESVPDLRDLIYGNQWRRMMHYVSSYATEPLYYIQTILKSDSVSEADPQTKVHADTFHPTMKAWFFLHDVGEEEGPFKYVPGSHLLTEKRLAWEKARSIAAPEGVDYLSSRGSMRIETSDLAKLDLPQPQTFAVSANTLIVADTCGFHARAASTGSNMRIEIWAYSRRNPYYPWLGGDILSLRSIAERRIQILWKAKDRLRKYIGQPWADVGAKRPGDQA
jgi:Phytanoyl-CoA dioxygenase (PhyH)